MGEPWYAYLSIQTEQLNIHDRNLGELRVADIEDKIVMAFTQPGGSENTRIVSICNHAYRVSSTLFGFFASQTDFFS